MILEHIVAQHADEAAFLWSSRRRALQAPHYRLPDLAKLDERLDAHLEGLLIAGEDGKALCEAQIETGGPGEMFAAVVLALHGENRDWWELLLGRAEKDSSLRPGLGSALGWVAGRAVPDFRALLEGRASIARWAGVSCAALQRLDPGHALTAAVADPDDIVRARALRAVGELGRRELAWQCQMHLDADHDLSRFWAAWSLVLLGSTGPALQVLHRFCLTPGPMQARALQITLPAMGPREAHGLLKMLEQGHADGRLLVRSVGLAGDPAWVPWLIDQMRTPSMARLAGEAFTCISGVDIAQQALVGEPPAGFQAGPADDLDDPGDDVEMDPDEDLPWPDPCKLTNWWRAHEHQFQTNVHYLAGEPFSMRQAQTVLRDGTQRQRISAAFVGALLQPGAPLFEWREPAWRQWHRLYCADG